jgi:outer membrane protein assembly factor BamB
MAISDSGLITSDATNTLRCFNLLNETCLRTFKSDEDILKIEFHPADANDIVLLKRNGVYMVKNVFGPPTAEDQVARFPALDSSTVVHAGFNRVAIVALFQNSEDLEVVAISWTAGKRYWSVRQSMSTASPSGLHMHVDEENVIVMSGGARTSFYWHFFFGQNANDIQN